MMGAVINSNFEFVALGFHLKAQSIGDSSRSTSGDSISWGDRVAAVAFMDTQIAKSVTMLLCVGKNCNTDFNYVLHYLAQIMLNNAYEEKKKLGKKTVEPDNIALYALAERVAYMKMAFFFGWRKEENFSAQGKLEEVAGIPDSILSYDAYRKTWKAYETEMDLALLSAYGDAEQTIIRHRKSLKS